MAAAILGVNLYLSGEEAEHARFHRPGRRCADADEQPFVVVTLLAICRWSRGGRRCLHGSQPRPAGDGVAEARGVRYDPLSGFAYIALARSLPDGQPH